MPLLLEGIVRCGGTFHRDGGGLDLQGLFRLGGQNHGAGDGQGGAHVLSGDLFIILQGGGIHNDLQIFEAGAVVELNKAEGLHVPDRAGPAGHGDFLAAECLLIRENLRDLCAFHWVLPLSTSL